MAVDPFDIAMAQLRSDPGEKPSDAPRSTKDEPAAAAPTPAPAAVDPFEAALQQIDQADTGAAVDPFEAALQQMDQVDTGAAPAAVDPFEAALAVADSQVPTDTGDKKEDEEFHVDIDFLMDINLTMTFEVGRAKMYISDLLSLGQGSVIELHRLVGEDLEILVNGNLLATGEVVVVNEKFGAKLTKILSPEERVTRLGPTPI